MGDESTVERYTSFGRGGAGNLRRPSVVEEAKNTLANMVPEPQRRRSSVWSFNSNSEGSRRGSILDKVLRRSSTTEVSDKDNE